MRTFKVQIPETVKCSVCETETEVNDHFDVCACADGGSIRVTGYVNCISCGAENAFGGKFLRHLNKEDEYAARVS